MPYRGRATSVFAVYADPSTLTGQNEDGRKYPGIVLLHGGGGHAEADWVRQWADWGYAAIAIDMAGCGINGQRLSDGGPDQDDLTKFSPEPDIHDQWTYHAVANSILAHSLLRSFPRVSSTKTAVTGVSWGGYVTCIVASVDHRFKAAVPVYGCGWLERWSGWDASLASMSAENRRGWITKWDPASYLSECSTPIFFISGATDFAYWLEAFSLSIDSVHCHKSVRLLPSMPHSGPEGRAPTEIRRFVDHFLLGSPSLPELSRPKLLKAKIIARIVGSKNCEHELLAYTTDEGISPSRKWQTIKADRHGNEIEAVIPTESKACFLMVTDYLGSTVSTIPIFLNSNIALTK